MTEKYRIRPFGHGSDLAYGVWFGTSHYVAFGSVSECMNYIQHTIARLRKIIGG